MADLSAPDNHPVSSPPGEPEPERDRSQQGRSSSTAKTNTRPAARGTAFYQRKRAVKACQVCRARRTKCDNLKPSCSFCLKVGATCIQSPVDLSSFDPASLKILERLDDLEELMRSVSVDGSPSHHKTRVIEAPRNPIQLEHRVETPDRGVGGGPPIQLAMIIPPRPEHVMSWAIFRDFGNGIEANDTSLHVDHASSAVGNSPLSSLGAVDLEMRLINDLLDRFFSYVHVKNPILDETATRKMVSRTVLNGVDWSAESCLSLLICALGSLATPFGPSHETMPGSAAHANAQDYFRAAQKRLGGLFSSDDIIAAQCLFLSGVYMMCVFQPVKAWRHFVQALASCQQFPFLTPEAQQRYHSNAEAGDDDARDYYSIDTLQQAVYWSSWKSEREMRGDLYLPDFSLADQELGIYPPFFPTPPAPRAEVEEAADPRLARERTSWYFYLAEISLRRLASRISAEMVGLQREHSSTRQAYLAALAEAVPRYEEQAREWIASLPPSLSFSEPAEEDDVCRFVLRGHALNLYEQIYWPFTTAVLDGLGANPDFPRAAVSSGAVALANKGLDNHLYRLVVNRLGYRHRHHGTLPMMRSCSRSALVLAAAAILSQSESNGGRGMQDDGTPTLSLPSGWYEAIEEVIDLLAYWECETRDMETTRRLLEKACAMFSVPSPAAYRMGV
ncbi:glucan -beta-glucosidase [Colletotrichum tabaci]|uniref:Glucan -beta-glucosidase n=1 Tax=Colletotrichum tabaci TaxID=1209068 RepID=A0AAV9TRM6_9PEZI